MKRRREEEDDENMASCQDENTLLMACGVFLYLHGESSRHGLSIRIEEPRVDLCLTPYGLTLKFYVEEAQESNPFEELSYEYTEGFVEKVVNFSIAMTARDRGYRFSITVPKAQVPALTQKANELICSWINKDKQFVEEPGGVQWRVHDDHLRLYQPKRDTLFSSGEQRREEGEIPLFFKRIWVGLTEKALSETGQTDKLRDGFSGQLSLGSTLGEGGMYIAWEGYSLEEMLKHRYPFELCKLTSSAGSTSGFMSQLEQLALEIKESTKPITESETAEP